MRAYRTPLLNRTPLGAFWAHIGHFCTFTVQNSDILGQKIEKKITVGSQKFREFNRKLAFYRRRFDTSKFAKSKPITR